MAGAIVKHNGPATGEQLGTQKEKNLSHWSGSEGARRFEAQIDDPANGAFHAATAARESSFLKGLIAHAGLVCSEVGAPLFQCSAQAGAGADALDFGCQVINLALPEKRRPSFVKILLLSFAFGHIVEQERELLFSMGVVEDLIDVRQIQVQPFTEGVEA